MYFVCPPLKSRVLRLKASVSKSGPFAFMGSIRESPLPLGIVLLSKASCTAKAGYEATTPTKRRSPPPFFRTQMTQQRTVPANSWTLVLVEGENGTDRALTCDDSKLLNLYPDTLTPVGAQPGLDPCRFESIVDSRTDMLES